MKQENVKAARMALEARARIANDELTRVAAEYEILQRHCKHPGKHSYTSQGDTGERCPDCNLET